MRKKTHKKIRASKRRSRRRGGKEQWVDKHSDVGLATFDVFLGGNNDDEVKDLDVAMREFDLFDQNQNTSEQDDFGNISMISGESDEEANLNDTINVFDDEDDEIVPENSIPFDEEEWMNLDEGFMDTNANDDIDDSYLNETTNESISFGGTKKRRKMRKRKTSKKRKLTRKLKKRKYNRKTRKHIKIIKMR